MKSKLRNFLRRVRKPLSYDEEKRLARHDNVKVRVRFAARGDARPEILYYMAEDPAPEVRREIAANDQTPQPANLVLACDTDETVRSRLAEKVAKVAPGLSRDDQDRLNRMAYQAVELLARDQVSRVRQVLAEALKEIADAPPEIIGLLARDSELAVAGPILRHSPVLTDDDLVEIIQSCPVEGAITAISSRKHVTAQVADAVVAADDIEAITALLGNKSAQIREETLDRIIDRAPEVEAWHAPLVRRPALPPRAAIRIARFVADELLEQLEQRADLPTETVAAVKAEVSRRLEQEASVGAERAHRPAGRPAKRVKAASRTGSKAAPKGPDRRERAAGETPAARARRLKADGALDEEAIAAALEAGDMDFVAAAIALLADEPLALVEKVVDSRSAKGMTALCWKAGLGMRFGTQLQLRFARIHPSAVLNPHNVDEYPLTPDEMTWQIEFLHTMVPPSPTTTPANGR